MRALPLLLLLLLGGCVSEAEPPFPETMATPTAGAPAAAAERAVEAPALEVGRAWTYEGFEFYNEDSAFTVVVAEVRPDGYLFAGGSEDDLVYEALWWSRWYNVHDLELNRADFERYPLRFPLTDGASWAYSETLTVTARDAQVDTPLGKDDGFVITGANERVVARIEYSPRAQNIVRLHIASPDGVVFDDLRMTRVADAQPWVWYELGELVEAVPDAPAASFDVPDGFDHVIASAGGTTGARARVEGPGGASWSAEFDGAEVWKHGMLPATAGTWGAVAAGRPFVEGAPELPVESPVGWAYMHVAPVRWLRSG